jgi:hypothetical protein
MTFPAVPKPLRPSAAFLSAICSGTSSKKPPVSLGKPLVHSTPRGNLPASIASRCRSSNGGSNSELSKW